MMGTRLRYRASLWHTGPVDLAKMRHEYSSNGLVKLDLAEHPMDQFRAWLADAAAAQVEEPNAMVLSTVNRANEPSSRVVLLKGLSDAGFEFYTNYQSDKASDIADNPNVALTFPWIQIHRQVNVRGRVVKLSDSESDNYFAVRPRESQLGAWASNQSQPLSGRTELEDQMEAASQRFGEEVPRPPHWGGYRVTPRIIEFWQGRSNRLHDRLRFTRGPDAQDPTRLDQTDSWSLTRLNP